MRISLVVWAVFVAPPGLMLLAQTPMQPAIELEGAVSGVEGTTIQLFDGLVHVDASRAELEAEDDDFTLSDLKPGTAIELKAVAHDDGSIHATQLEVGEEKEEDTEIGGVIGSVDTAARTFTIGSLVIGWDDRTRFKDISQPQEGQLVETNVVVSGGRLLAREIEGEEDDD